MNNILFNFDSFLEIKNILIYFSCEIILFLGLILNLLIIPFRKKLNLIKTSTIITNTTFGLAIFSLIINYGLNIIKSARYISSFPINYLSFNNGNLLMMMLINFFILIFVILSSKHIKKYRYKFSIINSIAILLAICGCFIVQSENFIITYLMLEIASILIYKYASNMRLRKISLFSIDYIILSFIATLIFVIFYFTGFEVSKPSQVSIINVCLSVAILMKIGIFPIYNFLIVKPAKTNIPFSILLFSYLPWIGVIAFNKMADNIIPSDEIYQLSMIAFIIVSLITFSFYASKHKNLIKFLGNFSYFVNGFCILSIIYFQFNYESVWLSTLFNFCMISLFSLISIIKLNFKPDKINVSALKGLFLNNKLFAFLFSSTLIIMTGLIPSGIMKEFLRVFKNIYIFDKSGFIAICVIFVLLTLILFNCLKIVQTIYTYEKNNIFSKPIKRTTFNYVVPVMIFVFLLLKIIL